MIRFFGIILGFVLMANIAVTVSQSNYGFSSLTTFGKEAWRLVVEKVRKFDDGGEIIQYADIRTHTGDMFTVADYSLTAGPTAADLVEQVVENPVEVRIFWGPFNTRGAANGFAQMAESITGLPTEIVVKNMGRLYVAFTGEPEAIDIAIMRFASETGMNLNTDTIL